MHVVPDIVPELLPSIDLHVHFLKRPDFLFPNTRRRHASVEPGVYLLPEQVHFFFAFLLLVSDLRQTRHPPRLYATVFHTEIRLYTLLMVDPGS
jgi:large subunit ribosomal protein L35